MDRQRGRPEQRRSYSSELRGDFKASQHSSKKIHDTVPPLPLKDPRLSNDKYRAQMKTLNNRISPDTTMNVNKTQVAKTEAKPAPPLNPDASFSCSLCPTMFDSIGGVRAHLQQLHAIEGQDIWDPLTRIPKSGFLKSYKCKACPPTARYENRYILYFKNTHITIFCRPSVAKSENEMLGHFKDKHKIPILKPILLNRICRLCEKDGFKNDSDIDKHIKSEHPLENYCNEEAGNEEENSDFQASTSKADEDYFKKDEDELNYEPEDDRSPSP